MIVALEIFERQPGLEFLTRWLHVVVGIVWIGLLYYFNFVQVPAFAKMDPGARNDAIDKLASRALWWFRWSAAATFAFGILILIIQQDAAGDPNLWSTDYYKTAAGTSILTGALLGTTMFLNVWLVIWPNQRQVIANARNVAAGGQADPAAAEAGRRSALASRQNTIFSLPMLLFMVGTSHFFPTRFSTADDRTVYWAITLVVWAVLELNCLGIIGGRAQNPTNWIYEDHRRAIGTGLVLVVVWYVLWEIVFQTI